MTNQLHSPITVLFHGSNLFIVNHNNEPYVPMKPVVEGMGLDWGAQQQKLRENKEKFNHIDIDIVAADGKNREMICLPLKKLNGWLFSISPERVRADLKEKVIAYQEECFVVLHDYYNKGVAVNPRIEQPATLNETQAKQLYDAVMLRAA